MFILISFLYFIYEEDIKYCYKFLCHRLKIEEQNRKFREEKEKQRKFYEEKKRILKEETEKKIKEIDSEKEVEVNKINNKYKKLFEHLDSLKNKEQILDFFNIYINNK